MVLSGGRKYTVALVSLAVLLGLTALHAPDAAYTTLGWLGLGFFGAHSVQDYATAKNGTSK